jgi:hypothetical protein
MFTGDDRLISVEAIDGDVFHYPPFRFSTRWLAYPRRDLYDYLSAPLLDQLTNEEKTRVDENLYATIVSESDLGDFTSGLGIVTRDRRDFPTGYVGDVLRTLEQLIREKSREYQRAKRNLEKEFDPELLAREMIETTIPIPSVWDSIIGDHLSARGAMTRLGIDESQLARAALEFSVLELRTRENEPIYPRFQFGSDGLVQGFSDVLKQFEKESISPWTLAAWFVTPDIEEGSVAPIELLRSRRIDDAVVSGRRASLRFRQ